MYADQPLRYTPGLRTLFVREKTFTMILTPHKFSGQSCRIKHTVPPRRPHISVRPLPRLPVYFSFDSDLRVQTGRLTVSVVILLGPRSNTLYVRIPSSCSNLCSRLALNLMAAKVVCRALHRCGLSIHYLPRGPTLAGCRCFS